MYSIIFSAKSDNVIYCNGSIKSLSSVCVSRSDLSIVPVIKFILSTADEQFKIEMCSNCTVPVWLSSVCINFF